MKRLGGLWSQVVAFDNLLRAYHQARQGKRTREEVARFGLNLEPQLLCLQRDLETGDYRPGAYRLRIDARNAAGMGYQ